MLTVHVDIVDVEAGPNHDTPNFNMACLSKLGTCANPTQCILGWPTDLVDMPVLLFFFVLGTKLGHPTTGF